MNKTHPKKVIRYCPRCGDMEFSYRSDNSFYCAKCEFQLYINSATAVAALIVDEQDRLLLTQRAIAPCKGMLDLPGGFVDVMETAENALKREIYEELNLKIDKYDYLTSSPNEYVFGGLSVFTLDLAYICRVKSFNKIQACDDVSGFGFYKPSDIKFEDIYSVSIQKIIQHYLDRHIKN